MYGSSQSWKQTFVFDRFGNRTFNTSSGNTTTLPSSFNADIYNPSIDTSNNRYSTGQGYSYDAAGNVTANAAGQSFVYDAEHHQTEVEVTSTSATVATYIYDGSGQRVKKIVGTEETVFIYDAMGKSVAEYVLNSTTTPTVKTRYTTEDHLGSPRVITDGIGQVQERHEYLAYGKEAGSSLSTVRTTAQKYTSGSAVRDRYTGYERDDESGLDFAQARYYSSAHGRFTSVDPLTASATIKNPQTFNRYSYCLNSPYEFTDPLGLSYQVGGGIAGNDLTDRITTRLHNLDMWGDDPLIAAGMQPEAREPLERFEYQEDEGQQDWQNPTVPNVLLTSVELLSGYQGNGDETVIGRATLDDYGATLVLPQDDPSRPSYSDGEVFMIRVNFTFGQEAKSWGGNTPENEVKLPANNKLAFPKSRDTTPAGLDIYAFHPKGNGGYVDIRLKIANPTALNSRLSVNVGGTLKGSTTRGGNIEPKFFSQLSIRIKMSTTSVTVN